MTRVPPHDLDAERALLGAMMLTAEALAAGVNSCTLSDFYDQGNASIFDAMVNMHARGEKCEPGTVASELRADNRQQVVRDLVGMLNDAPPSSSANRYAGILVRHSLSRRLISIAESLASEAWEANGDPTELVEQFQAQLGALHVPLTGAPADMTTWDDFWDRPGEAHKPWVIPGLFRVGWRAIIVAGEGKGKTVVTRQIALCAGQGIHPFTFRQIPPVRTLVVDLENPEEHLDLTGQMMRRTLTATVGDLYQQDRTWLWHQPGGMNLRARPARAALEAAIAHVRPELVVIAPVYKMFRKVKGETDEDVTGEVQQVLDDLRTRYGFALLLEHHAPKGFMRARDMVPFGSSLWMRWPEIGLACLDPDGTGSLTLDRFRPDRLPCRWPDRLDRGGLWPWSGFYNDGMPQDQHRTEAAF